MEEIWKDISNFEGLYQVSNLGNVKRILFKNGKYEIKKDKIKTKRIDKYGYDTVALCKNGKQKNYLVHRLVALAFIPNLLNKPQVNHIDGNKQNNNVNNLEWCSNSENQLHAYQNNLKKKYFGKEHWNFHLRYRHSHSASDRRSHSQDFQKDRNDIH